MPIVDPNGFAALGLFPLQINPHFTNALPEGHKGETREQRIRELLVVAPELTIIGLPEGNWIQVTQGHATLGGPNPTLVFRAGEDAVTSTPVIVFKPVRTRPGGGVARLSGLPSRRRWKLDPGHRWSRDARWPEPDAVVQSGGRSDNPACGPPLLRLGG
jgi:hypothetical protein